MWCDYICIYTSLNICIYSYICLCVSKIDWLQLYKWLEGMGLIQRNRNQIKFTLKPQRSKTRKQTERKQENFQTLGG